MLTLTLNHNPAGQTLQRRLGHWLVAGALLGFGAMAFAQAEPTLAQVYETAQSGKLEQAQVMMQQVLVAHPNSAKAHFVQAELYAKQGNANRAREALAVAEKLSPGLAFAKPDAVQNLRTQLAGKGGASASAIAGINSNSNANSNGNSNGNNNGGVASRMGSANPPAPAQSSFPWGLALAGGGGLIALAIFFSRKKAATAPAFNGMNGMNGGAPGYVGSGAGGGGMIGANAGSLSGPQSFGMAGGAPAQGYGQPGYGQPQQPAGMGLGGKVVGGLAAGLAVGAGVMAAQAIGKSLMGNDDHSSNNRHDNAGNSGGSNNGDYAQLSGNNDAGGQNFGINDANSWDEGSSMASNDNGGGGDWDS